MVICLQRVLCINLRHQPPGPSCIELAEDAAYLNYSLRAVTCPDHGAGLGRVCSLLPLFKSGPRLMPDARVPSSFDPHLLLTRHPSHTSARPPSISLPPPLARGRLPAAGSPPIPLDPRQSLIAPLSAQSAFDSPRFYFCYLNDLLHEFRRSCLQ